MAPGNDRRTIVTFAVIALLILGMAVVNFTNLATARASQRAREVALRKVLGANRRQLIVQFIGESILVAVLAMLIALGAGRAAAAAASRAFLDADLELSYFGAGGIALPVLGLVLLVGVLGGLYPAFFLSRFQPAHGAQGQQVVGAKTPGTGRLRSRARRRPVRGLDRPHHLHRGDLRPDRLRPNRRSRLQARRHLVQIDEPQPLPADQQGRGRSPSG